MLSEKEIVSLIKMLDDPDVAISSNIISALSNTDKKTIPLMDEIWELSMDSLVRERIQIITLSIIENETISFLTDWKNQGEPCVMDAWFCIDELCNPQFNRENTLNFLNKIRFDAWKEMNDNQSTLEKCNILAYLITKKMNINITLADENNASSYLISNIIENTTASQTAITILFQEIAKRLDIDLFGLNVFEYAILGYLNPDSIYNETHHPEDVLFYLIVSDKISFIGNHQLDFGKNSENITIFKAATAKEIVSKIIYGLIQSYRKEGNDYMEKLCVKIYKTIMDD